MRKKNDPLSLPKWPPPTPSASCQLAYGQYFGAEKSLFSLWKKMGRCLYFCGYDAARLFQIPGGFAIATRAEKIKKNGAPVTGTRRFDISVPSLLTPYDGEDYLVSLLAGKTGYYRQIVYLITNTPYRTNGAEAFRPDFFWEGLNTLPIDWMILPFDATFTVEALIYEVYVDEKTPSKPQRVVGRLSGYQHLDQSGIFRQLASSK